ncbi:MAG TPA: hypothetical protein VG319_15265 [Polyangia bacterium]|jgi:hypothetical protein|nr:hypothetical protein [Polyangia bacterium]
MLLRVALGQVRFNLPGLTADARGVVGGKQLAVRFAALDRLVGFFRALAAEQSLDDLQPGLRIVYARGTAGTREAVVFLPASASSSQLGEVVARGARLAGGQCFTGTGKHFAQFRDAGAPLGYDAAAPSQEAADFVLYGVEHDVAYRVESELPLSKLLLRLSLQRVDGPAWPVSALLLLVARRGLGPLVAEYLHRARTPGLGGAAPREPAMRAAAALCEMPAGGAFRGARAFWLFRIEGAPARLRGLLTETPGLELYAPVTEHVAVAAGHRHPIALESCRSSFPTDHLTLFAREGGVVEIAPLPVFTAIEDVVRIRLPAAREAERSAARPAARPDVAVPLRLEPAMDARRRAVAALVPWTSVPWLRRLCYALPATALRGYRVAALERGVLVLAAGELEGLPFGTLLEAAAPALDVLVPVGTRLRPAVSPELLAERLGAQNGTVVVFPGASAPPFRIAPHLVEPFDRRALALLTKPDYEPAAPRDDGAPASAAVEIENDPLGPMPLWGLDG